MPRGRAPGSFCPLPTQAARWQPLGTPASDGIPKGRLCAAPAPQSPASQGLRRRRAARGHGPVVIIDRSLFDRLGRLQGEPSAHSTMTFGDMHGEPSTCSQQNTLPHSKA
eukprot:184267-Chlamydomonas_euryale.AAC.2